MRVYAPIELSANRKRTPEGFLLIEGLKVARTGELLYGPDEVPVEAGPDGLVRIRRDDQEVFRDESLASLNGKPFVEDHPDEDVTPANWRKLARGHLLHPRRGEGVDDMFVMGDLLVTDQEAIDAIEDGKCEISLGYDAEYEQIEPGLGRQKNIVVNHIALVDKGRCGPSCAIGDHAMTTKPKTMRDWLNLFGRTTDAAAIAKMLDEEMGTAGPSGLTDGVGGTTVITLGSSGVPSADEDPYEERFKKMEDALAEMCARDAARDAKSDEEDETEATNDEESEEEGEGKREKTGDSMGSLIKHVAAQAEILSPGFRMPTVDAKGDKAKAHDRLCACKRRALDLAYQTDEGKAAIDPFLVGKTKDFSRLKVSTIDTVFDGAATLMAQANNAPFLAFARPGVATQDANPNSVAAVAKANTDFWAKRA